jgi:hypothetical protein
MPKPLSDQFADLSVRAREAENTLAAAQAETRDRLIARREQTRAAAAAAADRVQQDLRDAGIAISEQWNAFKEKVTSDVERLNAKVAERQVERDVQKAADRAARRDVQAAIAIDFAITAVEDAKLAALDAYIANVEADQARAS